MEEIQIYHPEKKELIRELVYKEAFLIFLYGKKSIFSSFLRFLIARLSLFSRMYAFWQKTPFTKGKVKKFVRDFNIDLIDSQKTLEEFSSFSDFFIRTLKPGARFIDFNPSIAISPCDGRALVFPDLQKTEGFYVKGQKLSLEILLNDQTLFEKYRDGAMALIRLSPLDYHRFHFPFDCFAHIATLIKGSYYSVNPIALRKDLNILCKNKRMITEIDSEQFGRVLFIEVGATFVGTIHQTFVNDHLYSKGEEKGYFSFGGSTIILIFEKDRVMFEKDYIHYSEKNIETLIRFGQPLAKILR